jgi:hypothetical protein
MYFNLRSFALWAVSVLLLLALFTLLQNPGQHSTPSEISYSQLLNDIDQDRVRDVVIQGHAPPSPTYQQDRIRCVHSSDGADPA